MPRYHVFVPFALTTLAAAVVLGGQAAAADSCLDQVRDLASKYGAPSKPPTAALGGKADITTSDLARSGGVIAPPPVQDKSVITPDIRDAEALQGFDRGWTNIWRQTFPRGQRKKVYGPEMLGDKPAS